jgi:hypothetical protein
MRQGRWKVTESARRLPGCDKPPALTAQPKALSAEGGFRGLESGYEPRELAGCRRLFGGRTGKLVAVRRGASTRPMIRKIALAALAGTVVFQVAVFIQYGTLWGGALASYRELLLVFAFLLATFWVHAPIARLF